MKLLSFWIFNTDFLVLTPFDKKRDDVILDVGQGVEDDDKL